MAGIYIHIPFCKQACHYCDFHFSTSLGHQTELLQSIEQELILRKSEINNELIRSIYLGGGTPSIISAGEIQSLLSTIQQHFNICNDLEITLEANPDDLTKSKLDDFKKSGVNRLSIGIQTFDDDTLRFLNRAHNSKEALNSLHLARELGFNNVSADLIFAIPRGDSYERFQSDVGQLLDLRPEHISLYGLTVEPGTAFGNWLKKGHLIEVAEEDNARQYEFAIEALQHLGYEHYEVSNFCLPGFESRHNSSYWKNHPYLGVGPSAHSFDGASRRINVSNNVRYVKLVHEGKVHYEEEVLSETQKFNEYILTHIRTKWGLDLKFVQSNWRVDLTEKHSSYIRDLEGQGMIKRGPKSLALTSKGFSIADEVALRFFSEE